MRVCIVGGGWAGLSAAITATRLGHEVSLYESGAVLGGRARSVHTPALDTTIDNGQHILLGAYSATLELMRGLGLEPDRLFHRLPLSVQAADASLRMNAVPWLPAPLHIAGGLLSARGLSWAEKNAALRAIHHLRAHGWKTARGATVQEWLALSLQPQRLQRLLWGPLCIATMNTPPETACAQLFANVLKDSLGSPKREASDMLIPRVNLSELWPRRVEELAARNALSDVPGASLNIHRSSTVRRLHYASDSGSVAPAENSRTDRPQIRIDEQTEPFDAVILCCNPVSTARLLADLTGDSETDHFLATLHAFDYAPIATLTLRLSQPYRLPAHMLLLGEDRKRGHFGQWLFQGQDGESRLLHIVISDAGDMLEYGRDAAVAGMIEQLQEQLEDGLPEVDRHSLIVEKRATFLSVPDLDRPDNRSPWDGIWVAGDWTDTGYPAVLEGAVSSGQKAALAMDAELRA